jgi:glycosyltransferase involved in cell wall biosynthesis
MKVKRSLAAALLIALYEGARALTRLEGTRPTRSVSRILLIGTFHNTNWFYSHVTPLTKVAHVYLVCDGPIAPLDNLTYLCPPRWLSRVVGRAGAKFFIACRAALRVEPDLCMGYYIVPAAVIARVTAILGRCYCAYQATGGWVEVEGGGWTSETLVQSALAAPSPAVESAAMRFVSTFDLVVVRGSRALDYFTKWTHPRRIEVITGSVGSCEPRPAERDIDIIYAGRLTPGKRLHLLIRTIASLRRRGCRGKVVLVGAGPEEVRLKALARSLGVAAQIEFVGRSNQVFDYLRRSKLFLLTSESEGLSIAMLEAMSNGCVPVVANVGDLADAVDDGRTGILVNSDDPEDFATGCQRLLADGAECRRLSALAYEVAQRRYTVDAVAGTWTLALAAVAAAPHRRAWSETPQEPEPVARRR